LHYACLPKAHTLFTFEAKSICRQDSGIQPALKDITAEWVYFAQVTGIDKHSSFAVVFFMDQIDQLPGGTPVKISLWLNVQVAVARFELDLKIDAHALYPPKWTRQLSIFNTFWFRIRSAVASGPIHENLLDLFSDGIPGSQPGPAIDQAAAFEFKVVNEIRGPRH